MGGNSNATEGGPRLKGQQGGVLAVVAVSLGSAMVLGLASAATWVALVGVDAAEARVIGPDIRLAGLDKLIGNEGWFSLLGLISGLLIGVIGAAYAVARRVDPLAATLIVVPAALLAAVLAGLLGPLLGPADPVTVLSSGLEGDSARAAIGLRTNAPYVLWPIAAAFGAATVLLSGWREDA